MCKEITQRVGRVSSAGNRARAATDRVWVVSTRFALTVQPSIFTFGSIGIVWLVSLGLIFGIPALRLQENSWPPSAQAFFIDGFVGKLLLFGLVYAVLLVALLQDDDRESYVVQGIKYALFFAGAGIDFAATPQLGRQPPGHPPANRSPEPLLPESGSSAVCPL